MTSGASHALDVGLLLEEKMMSPRPFRFRRRTFSISFFALTLIAWLGPISTARAQFSYGYDSFVGYPQSQSYWNGVGYSGVYTDMSTQVHAAGSPEPYRGLAPYHQPPYGQFGRPYALSYQGRPAPVATAPPRAVVRRRGLLGKARGR